MFIIVSIILGFLSYFSIQTIITLFTKVYNCFAKCDLTPYQLTTLQNITENAPIDYPEVAYAIVSGIVIATIFGKMDSSNIINELGVCLKITNKLNDQSIYRQYLLNDELSWVYVRDIKNGLTYLGAVALLSDKENDREIVLNNVTVYTFPDSVELYSLQSIYLNFGSENIIIEEAKLEEDEQLEFPFES